MTVTTTVFAAAVADGAAAALQLVDRIEDVRRTYRTRVRTRTGSPVQRILDSLVGAPAITAAEVQATYRLSAGRASQILHQLAEANILRLSAHRASRAQVWVAHEVIDAVDTINATIPRRHVGVETSLDR